MLMRLSKRSIIVSTLSVQLAFFGLSILDCIGIQISDVDTFLRQVFGFIFLMFVPGFLILNILKLNNKSTVEIILYSLGLSLAFLEFIGVSINFLFLSIDLYNPISEIPLITTVNIATFLLYLIYYFYNKNNSQYFHINIAQIFSPYIFFLLSLPILTILGTYLINFYGTNLFLLILLAIISIIPILVVFNILPEKIYPFAIYTVTLSLLFHCSLITKYIPLSDNVYEYYVAQLVMKNRFWDPTLAYGTNSIVSVGILIPVISILCNVNLTIIYKIIAPLLMSIVPVGLYQIFKERLNSKIAFLSCFYFISIVMFYSWIATTIKQVSSYIFLVLIILLIIDRTIYKSTKCLLSIIFVLSLILSHYGTAYIFMIVSIISFCIILLSKLKNHDAMIVNIINPKFITLSIVVGLTWYLYISGGLMFYSIINTCYYYVSEIINFINLTHNYTITRIESETSLTSRIIIILYIISIFFSLVGYVKIFWNLFFKSIKIDEYLSLQMASFVLYLLLLSKFSGKMGIGRLYHLALIFSAHLCIVGGMTIITYLVRIFKRNFNTNESIKIISVFLMVFLLFNSGFISETVTKQYPPLVSSAVSIHSIREFGTPKEKLTLYGRYVFEQNIFSARWLSMYKDNDITVYCDYPAHHVLASYGNMNPWVPNSNVKILTSTQLEKDSYIYFSYANIIDDILILSQTSKYRNWYSTSKTFPVLDRNKIYTNGYSEIYK